MGKLYVSPLPDGIGNCVHLPMHDGCPDSPHCPTCPKLRANKRHLPVWENKATNLLITSEVILTCFMPLRKQNSGTGLLLQRVPQTKQRTR